MLSELRMHALSYLQKRGHLSMVAAGRQMFRRVKAMTPARFDVLYVIYEHVRIRGTRETRSIWQAVVHRTLGLARQTVWKAIVRLVELGFLEKKVDPESKQRRILVEPTEEGIRWIRRGYSAAFSERFPLPATLSGEEPPRHEYRIARDEDYRARRAAKLLAKLKLPGFVGCGEPQPTKVGREVAKTFNARIWARTPRGGNRGKRYLDLLDATIVDARNLAATFGDKSELLYALRYDPYYVPASREPADKDLRADDAERADGAERADDADDYERAVDSGGSERRSEC